MRTEFAEFSDCYVLYSDNAFAKVFYKNDRWNIDLFYSGIAISQSITEQDHMGIGALMHLAMEHELIPFNDKYYAAIGKRNEN